MSENCKLCAKVGKIRNSHIIPEFLFKPLYDSKHRFHMLSTVPDSPNRYEQKGIREKLLCQSCETLLSKYERYARTVLFGGTEISVQKEDEKLIIGDIDYNQFKLFQLSVLWRASVSNHRFFSGVNLGSRHQEILRKRILAENPESWTSYGCIICALTGKHEPITDFMLQPEKARIDGHICYRLTFGGFLWLCFVSGHSQDTRLQNCFLTESGSLTVFLKPLECFDFIRVFANQLHQAGKIPTITST